MTTLRIEGDREVVERAVWFFAGLPVPGTCLTIGEQTLEVTAAGYLGGRFLVVASTRS